MNDTTVGVVSTIIFVSTVLAILNWSRIADPIEGKQPENKLLTAFLLILIALLSGIMAAGFWFPSPPE